MHRIALGFAIALGLAAPAMADGLTRIVDREKFLEIVENRDLTRFAIRVEVRPSGDIVGRAFGRDVSGDWQWQDGYFCRSLFWGSDEIGDNCQQVEMNSEKLRFTSDRGTGQSADLWLD